MKVFAILTSFVIVAGCENPQLGVGATVNSGGVNVSPVFSGNVGGVGVAVSP